MTRGEKVGQHVPGEAYIRALLTNDIIPALVFANPNLCLPNTFLCLFDEFEAITILFLLDPLVLFPYKRGGRDRIGRIGGIFACGR